MEKILVVGGPGAGKTTYLMRQLYEECNQNNLPLSDVSFVSFSKSAVEEAKDRVVPYRIGKRSDSGNFRTLHSLAYSVLDLRRHNVMGPQHIKELSKILKMNLEVVKDENDLTEVTAESMMLHCLDMSKRTGIDPVEAFCNAKIKKYSTSEFILFMSTVEEYKASKEIYTFNDMIHNYEKIAEPLDVKLAMVDECQDLCPVQWSIVNKIFANVEKIFYAGDDDQTIYAWNGADVKKFLSLENKVDKKIVLDKSYRMPQCIFDFGKSVISNVEHRIEKDWTHADHKGEILAHSKISNVPLNTNEKWLVLARNKKTLREFMGICYNRGWNISIKNNAILKPMVRKDMNKFLEKNDNIKDFIAAFDHISPTLVRMGYEIYMRYGTIGKPNINITTMHSSKGMECDNVIVFSDVSREVRSNEFDDEHRLFYVAVTRAKKKLHLIAPKTKKYYNYFNYRGAKCKI